MFALPTPPARRLTSDESSAIAKRGRKLLRRGQITHRAHALLDCLLWSCRDPKTGAIEVSYTRLQRLAHMSRESVAKSLKQLQAVGLLQKIKRRVRALFDRGGVCSRQATSAYVLVPPHQNTESGQATVLWNQNITYTVKAALPAVAEMARKALEAIAAKRKACFDDKWLKARGVMT